MKPCKAQLLILHVGVFYDTDYMYKQCNPLGMDEDVTPYDGGGDIEQKLTLDYCQSNLQHCISS